MKILMIVPFYKTFIKEQVEHIAPKVDEIHVIVHHNVLAEISKYIPIGGFFDHVRQFTRENLIDWANIPENVTVHMLNTAYLIPDNRNYNLPQKIFKLFVSRLSGSFEFNIIHSQFTWPSGASGMYLKRRYNVPLMITTHALHRNRLDFFERINAISIWEQSDALINVSKKCCTLLRELGVEENKLWYIPNGVDLNKFYPMNISKVRDLLGIPQDKKVIVSVGNLVEKKGFEYGILAMKEVLKTRKDVIWYIVGSGYLRKKLENLIVKLGLNSYVHLVGAKPHKEIPLWMNAADVFVLPSLVENFGVVNIEAMACGKPVVSTYNGGSEEIITSNDYGFLCPPKDSKCLAERIIDALDTSWDSFKLREYAKRFDWDNVSEKIIAVYNYLLEERINEL